MLVAVLRMTQRKSVHTKQNGPLISVDMIVNLIAATRTTKELTIHSAVDQNSYAKGFKVSDEEMAQLRISREEFHGEWNYPIHPRKAAAQNIFALARVY